MYLIKIEKHSVGTLRKLMLSSSSLVDEQDSAKYLSYLREAQSTDLSDVEYTGCVTKGVDSNGQAIITFVPRIGFGYRDKTDELLSRMFLLFIKSADEVVSQPYSIVYSHVNLRWVGNISNQPAVYEYYNMLPRNYKKNLLKIYIIHPQMGIKMYFEFARVFLSAKFYAKLHFVDSIADFQKIVPPNQLVMPYHFLCCEDEDKGLKPSGVAIPLVVDFDPALGTTSIMARCASYLRENGGLQKTGLFRVAGDENLMTLVKTRLQPLPSSSVEHMRACIRYVVIGKSTWVSRRTPYST